MPTSHPRDHSGLRAGRPGTESGTPDSYNAFFAACRTFVGRTGRWQDGSGSLQDGECLHRPSTMMRGSASDCDHRMEMMFEEHVIALRIGEFIFKRNKDAGSKSDMIFAGHAIATSQSAMWKSFLLSTSNTFKPFRCCNLLYDLPPIHPNHLAHTTQSNTRPTNSQRSASPQPASVGCNFY